MCVWGGVQASFLTNHRSERLTRRKLLDSQTAVRVEVAKNVITTITLRMKITCSGVNPNLFFWGVGDFFSRREGTKLRPLAREARRAESGRVGFFERGQRAPSPPARESGGAL